jgi:hypothetical protein
MADDVKAALKRLRADAEYAQGAGKFDWPAGTYPGTILELEAARDRDRRLVLK